MHEWLLHHFIPEQMVLKAEKYQKQKSSKNTQDEDCAFLKFTTYPCEIFLMYLIFVFQTLLLLFWIFIISTTQEGWALNPVRP